MLVLLGVFPYLASGLLYAFGFRDLFRDSRGSPPTNWVLRLVAPVIVSGLTPLVILSNPSVDESDRALVALSPAAAILFVVTALSLLRDASAFSRLHLPVRVGDWELLLKRRHALIVVGLLVIGYGAVTDLYVTS